MSTTNIIFVYPKWKIEGNKWIQEETLVKGELVKETEKTYVVKTDETVGVYNKTKCSSVFLNGEVRK